MQTNANKIPARGVFRSKFVRFRYSPTGLQVFSYTPATRSHISRKSLKHKKKREFRGKSFTRQKNQNIGLFRVFLPILEVFRSFFRVFSSKNTFFRGHFAFLNGMQEKQKGKNDEKSKEKAVSRGTDIFSDSFHSTLKKPSFFRRKASS